MQVGARRDIGGTPMPRTEKVRIDQTGLSVTLVPPKRWKSAPNAGRAPAAGEPEWPFGLWGESVEPDGRVCQRTRARQLTSQAKKM